MTQNVSRLSDKWVWITLIGFLGIIGTDIGSSFIPNVKQYGYEVLVLLLVFIGLFILGSIQFRRLDKKQCKLGQHNPDELVICRDCHKRLEGSEDLIDQHNRELDKKLSTKGGYLKLILPSIAILGVTLGLGYWITTSSHADLINGINSMNATDPTSCLYLVKQQAMEKGANALLIGSHVVKATNAKWIQLDCIHRPIMDDLNQTCPIGVVPQIQGLDGFLCYPNERAISK